MIECTFEDGGKGLLRHVIVDNLVIKNGKVLLVKRANKLLEPGKWALVGGFVERDETTKQAAEREILEESGWEAKVIKLLRIKDSPNRRNEDRQNIGLVYICSALKKVQDADQESDDQQWFDLNKLPPEEKIAFDHADDIEFYKKYLNDNN